MVEIAEQEVRRLRAIEEAARWHLGESACRGWPQGEVLAMALGLDPDAPQQEFNRLLELMGIEVAEDPLLGLLGRGSTDRGPTEGEGA